MTNGSDLSHEPVQAQRCVVPWGLLEGMRSPSVAPWWRSDISLSPAGYLLPYGFGRSYGDCCMVDGTAIAMRHLDRLIEFDRDRGILRCEGGISLGALLDVVVPSGWMLPVVPGTQYVSVGGAIANDIHGKNHHHQGTFGDHVNAFELLRSDGVYTICRPTTNEVFATAGDKPIPAVSKVSTSASPSTLYEATIGGLGLTGLITWAEIALAPLPTTQLIAESLSFRDTTTFIDLCEESESQYEYVVAWFDAWSFNNGRYRGILHRARYDDSGVSAHVPSTRITHFPKSVTRLMMNPWSIRRFNDLYWVSHRMRPRRSVQFRQHIFPLDSIEGWNAMYGPRGFFQFQCVLPTESFRGIDELLQLIVDRGEGSFLGVLKRFGAKRSRGWLSFPMPGITLALDFPNRGESTRRLLADAGDIVAAHGGRIYPAKDACMSGEVFRGGFPRWQELEAIRDPRFNSRFWQRVTH